MRMIRSNPHVLPAILAVSLASPVALAQDIDPYGYVGADLGYSRLENESFPNSNDEVKDSRFGYDLHAGARLSRVFSIEGGFTDFGEAEDNGVTYSADGFTVAGLVHIPLADRASVYGKLGELFWDAKGETTFGSFDADGEDLFYGLGLNLPVGLQTDLRFEYERYALDDTDVDQASIGLNVLFGGS